ncbi:MAG: trypsin-like peptidase domain-containing protein [Flavobacteriaceae bacterium]|nr:trypsin-like peptidase domain-containing protein [Flavobacteriaceae bacterium]
MKKILTLVLVSVLGGFFTLSTYKLFIEKDNYTELNQTSVLTPIAVPVNYNTTNKNLTAESTIDFTIAAEKTINTVVHVKNTTVNSGQITLEDLFHGRRYQRQQIGSGSGVIISPDGYIITNNHVIDGAQSIAITTNHNKTYKAELIGADPKTDIALLKIDADENLPYTTFADSDNAKIGEWVLAVGNPFNLTSTVTAGIISAKSRDLLGGNTQSFIQTDAAVNPGNSGGALVNTNGDLIGINTAITSQTGNYVGYSFAVPSNIAKKVVEDIMEFGNVQNGILGITGSELNSKSAEKFGVNETEGFYVNEVLENSGAHRAGLISGDIIKQLDDINISKFSDLKGFLNTKSPNDIVNVKVLRNGTEKVFPVKLLKNSTIDFPVIGLLKEVSKSELKKHKTNYGLKISRLNNTYQSYWRKNGVKEGNIITAINDIKLTSIEDVEKILNNRSNDDSLRIELINSKGEKERYNFR